MFKKNCCNNRQGSMNGFEGMNYNQCCMEQQIIEPTTTNCVEKEFYHEVPHV